MPRLIAAGNGTSAFNPVGHHHHHHGHQQPGRTNNYSCNQRQTGTSMPSRQHSHHHHAAHNGEGSNGGNGASGTGLSTRDEGRCSSDLEGPPPQQQMQQDMQRQLLQEAEDELMEEPEGVVEQGDEREQQQDSEQAAQLQAIMASLHSMCGNPLMLQQAYGAAAAAAATAQQIVASAMHGSAGGAHQAGTLQRQSGSLAQGPPASQGFTPWHNPGEIGSESFSGGSLLQQRLAGQAAGMGQGQGHSQGASVAQQLQLQAAARLVELASNWDTTSGASTGVSGDASNALYASYAQLSAPYHYHHHHHHHHHHQQAQQQQSQQQQSRLSEVLPSLSGGAAAAAAAAAGLQQLQHGLGLAGSSRGGSAHPSGLAGMLSNYSGLEALTQEASAGSMPPSEGDAVGARQRMASETTN